MTTKEHQELIDKIVNGLKIAEREMLEEKTKNNEDVIVCGEDNIIRHIPAKVFYVVHQSNNKICLIRQTNVIE